MKENKLLILTVSATIIFMPVMLFIFAGNSTYAGNMKLDDTEQHDSSDAVNMTLDAESEVKVVQGMDTNAGFSLGIPLDYDTETDKIEISEDKAASLITIKIPTEDKSFYYRNELMGTQRGINSVEFDYIEQAAEFDIHTDRYYVPTLHLTPNELYLELNTPKELYGHVYLIDATHGGEDTGNSAYGVNEKDVTLKVATAVSDIAKTTGTGGIYMTRRTDESVSEKDRETIIDLLKPDIYVTLHVDADEDTRVTHGIRGNTNDPEKENDVRGLIAVIAAQTDQKDLGVTVEKTDDEDDKEIPVSEVDIYTGYVTNKAEALKMSEDTYARTVAKVIYAWLMQEED